MLWNAVIDWGGFTGTPWYYVMIFGIALALAIVYSLLFGGKTKDSRISRMQKEYTTMDAQKLAKVEDDRVVDAVVCNLFAKLDERVPDPYATIPQLSYGRRAVYCAWLYSKEVESAPFQVLMRTPTGQFLDMAIEAYQTLRCPATAEVLIKLRDKEEPSDEFLDALRSEFLTNIAWEHPIKRCVEYIRENPEEFVDDSVTGLAAPTSDPPTDAE